MKKIILLFIIFSIAGCRKKDPDAISGVYLFPQEVKDYTLFKPGTYWIYQDSITGIEDSVYVINYSAGIDTVDINSANSGKEVVEYFGFEIKHSLDHYINLLSCNSSYSFRCIDNNDKRPCFLVNREKYIAGEYVGQGFEFLFDFYIGYSCYASFTSNHSRIKIINTFDSITVKGTTYQNISQFYDDKNINENDNRTNTFFAKNIGIVRKELLDSNQTWNIIRYHIVQ